MKSRLVMCKLFESLCILDERNPSHIDMYPPEDWTPEEKPVPRVGCYCDNCHSGQDRLAVIAIDLLEVLKKAHRVLRKSGYGMTEIDIAITKAEGG